MPEIHIEREHGLGLAEARRLAAQWAEDVEREFDMRCTVTKGKARDEVGFTRSGVNGTLVVTPERFELDAKLGLLLGAFKDRIEREIVKKLDALLTDKPAKPKS